MPLWKRENFPQTDYEDYEFLRRNVPNIEECAYAILGGSETIRYEGETLSNVNVTAISHGIYTIDDLKIEQGRFYTELESDTGSPVIVLGSNLAENLFYNLNPIGKVVRVFGRKLTVIGVLKKYGVGFGDSPDDKAFVPVNFVRAFRNGGVNGLPGAVVIKPKAGVDIGAFEEILKQKYRAHRGLKADEDDNFFINKLSGLVSFVDDIISGLNTVGWVISGFSLLVGGFGIANIMFVSVKERTNLIGIQKSLGAKNRFILFQFLFEATILAVVGGLVGLFFVWVIATIINVVVDDFEFILSFGNMFLGFLLSTCIGLIAGVIPAISASKLDPVEAIRTGM